MGKRSLLGIYAGITHEVLGISYEEALRRWSTSDYVLVEPRYGYAINGGLYSGLAQANDSFGQANAFLHFNRKLRRFELRVAGDVTPGQYEILINCTKPHCLSAYWTTRRVYLLPAATRVKCPSFYCSARTKKVLPKHGNYKQTPYQIRKSHQPKGKNAQRTLRRPTNGSSNALVKLKQKQMRNHGGLPLTACGKNLRSFFSHLLISYDITTR